MTDTAATKLPKTRADAALTVGVIALIIAMSTFVVTIVVSFNRELTPLESALFNSLTFTLSTIGSVLISAHFARRSARGEYEQLARPALRRVAALEVSTGRVAEYIDERRSATEGDESVWLGGLSAQLKLLLDQLTAATVDWRELLPSDYQEVRRDVATIAQIDALSKEIQQLKEERTRVPNADERIAELREQVRTLSGRLASERGIYSWAAFHKSLLKTSPVDFAAPKLGTYEIKLGVPRDERLAAPTDNSDDASKSADPSKEEDTDDPKVGPGIGT